MWSHSCKHRSVVTNAAILHQYDDVYLLYHCNAFVSLLSVYGLSSFNELIFQKNTFQWLLFYVLYEVNKCNVTSSFLGI